MSKATNDVVAETKIDLTPQYLGYHKHLILKLLSDSNDLLLPFADTNSFENHHNSSLPFSNGMISGLSEVQRERLKGVIDQSVLLLNKETDKIYGDIQDLMQHGERPKETIEECSDEISVKLAVMERNLEDFIDTVVLKGRPMMDSEKELLGQRIAKLPLRALDRVVEIMQRRTPNAGLPCNKLDVNLDDKDDIVLWRLYTYVEAVMNVNTQSKKR